MVVICSSLEPLVSLDLFNTPKMYCSRDEERSEPDANVSFQVQEIIIMLYFQKQRCLDFGTRSFIRSSKAGPSNFEVGGVWQPTYIEMYIFKNLRYTFGSL